MRPKSTRATTSFLAGLVCSALLAAACGGSSTDSGVPAASCASFAGTYNVTTEIVSTTCALGLHTITQPLRWVFVQTAPSCSFTMTNPDLYPNSQYTGYFTMVGNNATVTWTSVTPAPTVLTYTLSYTSENLTIIPAVAPATTGTISGSFNFSMSTPCTGTTNVCNGSIRSGCLTPG
jgi:hypothetical protein